MNNKRTLSKAGSIVSIVSWSVNILLYIYLGYVLLDMCYWFSFL